jgi:LacI family transcriptional regulator
MLMTGTTTQTHRGRSPDRKRRVMLAMGLHSHERQIGIARYAREAGWVLDARLLAFHAIDREKEYIDSSRYDGVLALMSRLAPWLPPLVKSLNLPVVDMWADFPDEKYPRVLLDHETTGRIGAEYLLAKGFRELLFYTHSIEGRAVSRRESFRQATLAANAHFHELLWNHASVPGKSRQAWLAEGLSRIPKPFAVMAGNDHIATEVLEAAEQAELRVPQDVAVLGVDNDPLVSELTDVPLSSIDSARERAGYEAAALLDRLMRGEPAPAEPMLIPPGRVVTRRSTDVLAVSDPEVAKALIFIRDHFGDPITVDDVADASLLSRRHLQDRFLAATGRTVREAMMWQRIDHAKKLLTETRAKVQSIAHQSGFHRGEHMSKVFRQWVGMSPQQFRERYSADRYHAPDAAKASD